MLQKYSKIIDCLGWYVNIDCSYVIGTCMHGGLHEFSREIFKFSLNQKRHFFVIFPTQAKYIRFWKINVYKAEATATGRWTFLPPTLFFQLGSYLWRYYSEGATWFAPPPHWLYQDQERLILFSRGSEIIELLREIFCNTEIFTTPCKKFPPPYFFSQWIMSKPWTVDEVENVRFGIFYLFLNIKMKGIELWFLKSLEQGIGYRKKIGIRWTQSQSL